MSDSKTLIGTKEVIEKIDRLMKLYEASLKTISLQREEIELLKSELQQIKSENSELQDRLKTSRLAVAMQGNQNSQEAIAKINRMVREIDSCIALLNK